MKIFYIILHPVYQKSWWYDLQFLRYWVCNYGSFFAPWPLLKTQKSELWQKEKNCWRYHHFIHVYHKWQSYNAWFLRYEARQTEFFVILGYFLPFYPSNSPKNQNEKKKMKNMHGDIIILHKCTKIMIKCYIVLEIWHVTDVSVIFHFGLFFALLPP